MKCKLVHVVNSNINKIFSCLLNPPDLYWSLPETRTTTSKIITLLVDLFDKNADSKNTKKTKHYSLSGTT